MKLPRHAIARNTVGELQSLRQQQISPREAAGAELSKFGAIGAGVYAASEVTQVIAETNRQLDDANDKVDSAIQDAYYENAEAELDAEHEERSLTDPTWTQENYIENKKANFLARKDAIKNIRNPQTRAMQEKIFAANEPLILANAAATAASFEARKIATNWTVGYNEFVKNKQWDRAYSMLDIATQGDNPIVDPIKAQELRSALDQEVEREVFEDEVADTTKIYFKDQDAGLARYKEIAASDMPEDRKQAMLDALDASFANVNNALARENEQKEAGFILKEQDYKERIKSGENVDVNALYDLGELGRKGSISAANRRGRLREVQAVGVKISETAIAFAEKMQNGDPMPSTNAFREQADAFYSTMPMVDDEGNQLTQDQALKQKTDFYKGINLVGKNDSDNLKHGVHNAAGLVKGIELFDALTNDPLNEPDMGLNEKERAAWELMSKLSSFGLDKNEAAMDTLTRINVDENTRITRNDIWRDGELTALTGDTSDSGDTRSAEAYNSTIDSKEYDAPGLWNVTKPGYDAYLDYQGMYRNAFMITGDWDVAEKTANRQFKDTYKLNNLNSPDGEDWEITRGPFGGDYSAMRANMIDGLKIDATEYLVRSEDGKNFYPSKINSDEITFENARKDGDDWVYTAMYQGVALPATPYTTTEIRLTPKDLDDLGAFIDTQKQIDELNKNIEKNQKQIESLANAQPTDDALMNLRDASFEPSVQRPVRAQTSVSKQDLENEIKMWQSDLKQKTEKMPKFK